MPEAQEQISIHVNYMLRTESSVPHVQGSGVAEGIRMRVTLITDAFVRDAHGHGNEPKMFFNINTSWHIVESKSMIGMHLLR